MWHLLAFMKTPMAAPETPLLRSMRLSILGICSCLVPLVLLFKPLHAVAGQSSRLAAERMLYKMHRMALAWGTAGSRALCKKYLMPILKKSQYRIQMTNPIATVSGKFACSTIGASSLPPDAGRAFPVKGEDFGYLIWRKRNCCML